MKISGKFFLFLALMTVSAGLQSQNPPFPPVIDLKDTTMSGVVRILPNYHDDRIGYSSATGDLNGDGIDDLVIGAPHWDVSEDWSWFGKVFVIFGSESIKTSGKTDLSENNNNILMITSQTDPNEGISMVGKSVSLGDVSQDGIDDLIIGGGGYVFLVFGSTLLTDIDSLNISFRSEYHITINTTNKPSPEYGLISDLNNDSHMDVVVYDDGNYNRPSLVYAVSGAEVQWPDSVFWFPDASSNSILVDFGNNEEYRLISIESADYNSDGYNDLLCGTRDSGFGYIVWGNEYLFDADTLQIFADSTLFTKIVFTSLDSDWYNRTVNTGDVNNDGISDVFINNHYRFSNRPPAWRGYVLYGNPELSANREIDYFETELSTTTILYGIIAGTADIDGDGLNDLSVIHGEFDPSGTQTDRLNTVYTNGSAAAPGDSIDIYSDTRPAVRILYEDDYRGFWSSFTAGDYNNDGAMDIFVSGISSGGSNFGVGSRGYILFGGRVIPTGIGEEKPVQPASHRLSAYPNPFNANVRIQVSLSMHEEIDISVYSVSGRMIKTVAHANCPSGEHRFIWNGDNEAGAAVSSGIYFIAVKTPSTVLTKKVLLLR